jgi:hypothetical protein
MKTKNTTAPQLIETMGRSPWRLALLLIPIVFACFALSPMAQAQTNGNTHFGNGALRSTTTGIDNTAIGFSAMFNNTSGSANTANGSTALISNRTGAENTATGSQALLSNTTGVQNTATGFLALAHNITGRDNTANGWGALLDNGGDGNTATGDKALFSNTIGNNNTANGFEALFNNHTGERNTAIGFHALENNNSGSFNVALGAGAGSGVITADDVICIGRGGAGVNVSNTCFIGNIRGVTTQNGNALPVVIDGAGQLGTMSSSKRFKKEIKPMENASDSLLRLQPVTFHYKSDGTNRPEFGLIAEDVAKVNPDLVVRDESGEIYTVRYDAVNAMLLNEFLKARRQIDAQQKQIDALTAGLQKVSAQVKASEPAPQVVNNP